MFVHTHTTQHNATQHAHNASKGLMHDAVHMCACTGMFAIRAERDYVINEDFMKAARKVGENKKLETTMSSQWGGDVKDRK